MNSMPVNSYRDLIAWQKAMDTVCLTYELTRLLPIEEKYGLMAQMRRCAGSVPSNVAEGWGRQQGADYLRFLFMARGSVHGPRLGLRTQHTIRNLRSTRFRRPMEPYHSSLRRDWPHSEWTHVSHSAVLGVILKLSSNP
jgi:four helix bundle protein